MTADLEQVVAGLEAWAKYAPMSNDQDTLLEAAALLRSQAAEIASLKGGISSVGFCAEAQSPSPTDGPVAATTSSPPVQEEGR